MVMRPGPIKIRCTQCGWRKTARPRTDAVTEREMPSSCPRCGGKLTYDMKANALFEKLKRWF